MPFVTTLTVESGDRDRLEDVVADVAERAERKGVECKGPHSDPADTLRVPQSRTVGPDGGEFPAWGYTVYTRTVELVGAEEFAREVTGEGFPDGVHVAVDVEQRTHAGGS